MIQLVTIANPLQPQIRDVTELYYNGGTVGEYVETFGQDVVLDGVIIEKPDEVHPADGSQIIVMPHVAGKGLKRILGFAAMIALTVYAGNVANGLWGGLFKAGSVAATLASGAVMFIGGKIINSIFPQQNNTFSWQDNQSSQSYGWDIPTPTTIAGYVVGETYGEAMPAAQLLEQHVETIDDKQYLNLLYCGGYGPVDSIDNIRIDYTDIGNYSGVELETRLGTNDQEPISFFKNTPLDQSVGIELAENGNSVTRTTDTVKASALEVTLEWPGGLFYINDNSSYSSATVKFKIEYRKKGTTEWTSFGKDEYSKTAASNSAVRESYKVEGLEAAQYDVRVTMVDRPHTTRYQTMTQWTLLTSYIDGQYSRPNKVLVGMRILASNQLSGGVPSLNWRQTRKYVYVWNPTSRAYEQKAADNPIWAAYDILHHCRHLKNVNTGEHEYVADGVDKDCFTPYYDEWTAAAAYADEEIENQDGEKEPRYRFDAIFDTAQKRMTAAQKAANIGHAAIITHGRNYGIVVDKPGTMTQIFGEGRTTVSSVKGSFSSKEDRARAIEVTYNDGQNDFKNTVIVVRSPNYNTDDGTDNTTQLSLFGVKRRSQAYREAITALATNERQIQTIELSADIDAIVAEYGDIVGYNHAVSRIGIASGRLESATATTVTLDKDVTLEASRSYEIYITLADDTLLKAGVVSKDYTGRELTLSETLGTIPERFDNYAFGEVGKAVKPFRVVSAERDGDLKVSLKLAEYDEAAYATELDYSKYPVVDYMSTPALAQVKNVTATEDSYISGGAAVSDIHVDWTVAGTGTMPDSYIVAVTARDSSYTQRQSTNLTSVTFRGVKHPATYDISVTGIYDAMPGQSATTMLYVAGLNVATSAEISGLTITRVQGGLMLGWNPALGGAAVTYSIYRGDTGAEMSACTEVASGLVGTTYKDAHDAAGTWQYYVAAVDTDGKQQGGALSGLGTITAPSPAKNIETKYVYRHYEDGSTGYDVVVSYELPSDAVTALVHYKTNHVDSSTVGVIEEGRAADEIGYQLNWKYAGDSDSSVTIPAAQIGDKYQIRVQTRDAYYTTSTGTDVTAEIVAKTEIPNTPQGLTYQLVDGGMLMSWKDVTNTDVDCYELRTNESVGAAGGLLTRATGTTATVQLSKRRGTVYLYARNTGGKYSYPATITYRYDKPDAPTLTLVETPRGSKISVPAFPSNVNTVHIYINGTCYTASNPSYTYTGTAGIYTVTACYVDTFGEGNMSAEYQMTIKPTLDESWIADEAVSLKKVDKTISDAVADAQKAIPRLDSIDGNIEKINTNISELRHTDSELSSTIVQNKKDADNADAALASQIKQTAESITSTVESNKAAQDTKNKSIDSDISQLKQTADSITSTVQSNKTDADSKISGLSSKITQNANSITSVVTNLGDSAKAQSAYSAIAQLQDGIDLRVKSSDFNGKNIVSQINVSPNGTLIDGKYLHVTGTTKFDDNVIVNEMLAANSITADKLSAGTIAITGSQAIKGGAVTLNANGMKVMRSDGSYVTHDGGGISYHTKSGNVFSILSCIMPVQGSDGQYCKFTAAWSTTPVVIYTLGTRTKTDDASKYGGGTEVVEEGVDNISINGFSMHNSVRYKKGTKANYAGTTSFIDDDSGMIHTYTCTWTAPFALKNQRITVLLNAEHDSDTDEYGDGETNTASATSSVSNVVVYVNDVKKYSGYSTSGTDKTLNFTFDFVKGDVVKVTGIAKDDYDSMGGATASASASIDIYASAFTLPSDIVLKKGNITCIVADKINQQYTLT